MHHRFAALLLEKGLATREQIDECVEALHDAADANEAVDLAEMMVARGYISRKQAQAIQAEARGGKSSTSNIAGYELLGVLGRGAMGVVYKARQVTMDRIVAVKLLRPNLSRNEAFVERFVSEAHLPAGYRRAMSPSSITSISSRPSMPVTTADTTISLWSILTVRPLRS